MAAFVSRGLGWHSRRVAGIAYACAMVCDDLAYRVVICSGPSGLLGRALYASRFICLGACCLDLGLRRFPGGFDKAPSTCVPQAGRAARRLARFIHRRGIRLPHVCREPFADSSRNLCESVRGRIVQLVFLGYFFCTFGHSLNLPLGVFFVYLIGFRFCEAFPSNAVPNATWQWSLLNRDRREGSEDVQPCECDVAVLASCPRSPRR